MFVLAFGHVAFLFVLLLLCINYVATIRGELKLYIGETQPTVAAVFALLLFSMRVRYGGE